MFYIHPAPAVRVAIQTGPRAVNTALYRDVLCTEKYSTLKQSSDSLTGGRQQLLKCSLNILVRNVLCKYGT